MRAWSTTALELSNRLAPAYAQRIVGITDDGDDGLIASQTCQDYVKALAPAQSE